VEDCIAVMPGHIAADACCLRNRELAHLEAILKGRLWALLLDSIPDIVRSRHHGDCSR
jgi:hypothetical protein